MKIQNIDNTPLYVYIPIKLKKKFEKIATRKGTSLSALTRMILEEYVSKESSKPS